MESDLICLPATHLGGAGGVDDAGRGLDDLMHAFPVRTRDQEVLNNQSVFFSKMRLFLLFIGGSGTEEPQR